MTAGCRVLSPLCFTHSLSPSLHLQSALHREKHVEGNCKCAELWESVYAECTSVSERQGQGIRKRNYKRGARFAPGIIVIVCCMCVSMHVTVCTLQCWTGKVAASAHPSLGLCSIRGQHCVSGSVAWDRARRVGWRAGAAGSRGPSAPSATQAAWVHSTRVSTVLAKATARQHRAVTLLAVQQRKLPHSAICSSSYVWKIAVIPPSISPSLCVSYLLSRLPTFPQPTLTMQHLML